MQKIYTIRNVRPVPGALMLVTAIFALSNCTNVGQDQINVQKLANPSSQLDSFQQGETMAQEGASATESSGPLPSEIGQAPKDTASTTNQQNKEPATPAKTPQPETPKPQDQAHQDQASSMPLLPAPVNDEDDSKESEGVPPKHDDLGTKVDAGTKIDPKPPVGGVGSTIPPINAEPPLRDCPPSILQLNDWEGKVFKCKIYDRRTGDRESLTSKDIGLRGQKLDLCMTEAACDQLVSQEFHVVEIKESQSCTQRDSKKNMPISESKLAEILHIKF